MPQTGQFREVQSGDDIRLTLSDTTVLDCTVRRFVGQTNTLIVTTPLGEDDPTLQVTYYIDDFIQFVFPIPPTQSGNVEVAIGSTVEVRFSNAGVNQTISGTLVGSYPATGVVQIDSGGSIITCKDFWSIEEL